MPEVHADHLERLNGLMAEELEAGIRYLHLAMTLKGLDRILIKDILMENMRETFEHAQSVGEKILQLGGCPKIDVNLDLAPEKTSASEALQVAVTVERAALDAYRDLLEDVEKSDESNVLLEEFLRAQVALESEHVSELELLLED